MARTSKSAQAALLVVAALAVAGLSAAPVPAGPLDSRIVTVGFRYLPGETTITTGTALEYTNADVAPHNVIALRNGRDGKPVFHTDTIGAGTTVAIAGVSKLKPGVYDYTCTLHPEMLGTIFVEAR
jgi:plastocyanin